ADDRLPERADRRTRSRGRSRGFDRCRGRGACEEQDGARSGKFAIHDRGQIVTYAASEEGRQGSGQRPVSLADPPYRIHRARTAPAYRFDVRSRNGRVASVVEVTVMSPRAPIV